MEWNPYDKNCPTRRVLDRVADKWSVLILVLLQRGPVRFNALRRAIQGISQKVLSQTLKELERDGLIHREVFPTVPVTVEYSITPLGKTLAEVVRGLTVWAEENMSAILQAQRRYDEHLAPNSSQEGNARKYTLLGGVPAGRGGTNSATTAIAIAE